MNDEDFDEPNDLDVAEFSGDMDNASSRTRSESHKRRVAREAHEARLFWNQVFETQVGRREMWRLLDQMHPFESRFAAGPNGFPQPDATWFNAGQQAIGFQIYQSWFVSNRDGVGKMHDENDPRFVKPKGSRA